MYQEILSKIASRVRSYGRELQPPCSPEQLQRFRDLARAELQVEIPQAYVDFLHLHNGLDWNGFSIYATETVSIAGRKDRIILGCVEANLIRREYPKWRQFLILGTTGDDEYCLEITTSRYVIVDAVSTDIVEAFPSFEELITAALRWRIS